MLSSQEAVREYLKRTKQLVGEADSIENAGGTLTLPTEKDSQFLQGLIQENAAANRRVLYFSLFLAVVVFVATLIVSPKNGSLQALLTVVGVGTSFEAGILAWVLRVWSEYNRFAILQILCTRLGPEELMRSMLALNFSQGKRPAKRRALAATGPRTG